MQFRGVPVKRGIIACMIFFSHICDLPTPTVAVDLPRIIQLYPALFQLFYYLLQLLQFIECLLNLQSNTGRDLAQIL